MRSALRAPFGLACAGLLALACGDTMPGTLGNSHGIDAGTDAAFRDAPPPPTCDLGPDFGVCACSEVTLLTDAPNLYFVLDRSGSMADGNKWNTVRNVVAKTVTRLGPRVNVGAALFPSDSSTCAAGREVFPVHPGDAPAGTLGPTGLALLSSTSVPAVGGTPTGATLVALTPKLTSLAGRTFVILATDGGPNCNSAATCAVDACILNIENYPGCPTMGSPNCCTSSFDGPESCLDADPTVNAVAALMKAGIQTYVIGVPGSGPYGAVLDRMAEAGGTARPTPPEYYRVDTTDASAFGDALAKVAAKITATCTFPLAQVPDPGKLNVFLDGVALAPDPTDGWLLDGTTVQIVGAACDRIQSGDVLAVRVVAGCPTIAPK
jgi:hypothetical protein